MAQDGTAAPRAAAGTWRVDHEMSTEGAVFLQGRVALFARIGLWLMLALLPIQILVDLAWGHPERMTGPLYTHELLSCAALLALWIYCRRGHRAPRAVRAFEALALLLWSFEMTVMGRYLNEQIVIDYFPGLDRGDPAGPLHHVLSVLAQNYGASLMALGMTQGMVLRAALVPTSARHTLGLTALVGAPVVLVSGMGWMPFAGDHALRAASTLVDRVAVTVAITVWWALTIATCTVISVVIYRLRAEVKQALKLGQYTLEDKLGEGGMGIVYRARHAMMRRPTAVKLLPLDRAGADALARFEREVQLTARLTHPNTITIYDYGRTPDGVFYYAMELLDGASVERVVEATGPQPASRVIHVLRSVASALAEAHELGLVHRDIKPANIVLSTRGGDHDVPKVLDFGLVKSVNSGDAGVTQAGVVTGTPHYLAPEALSDGAAVDARSDLYALGGVGYFMLTGRNVFDGKSVIEVCSHQLLTRPTPPSERRGAPVPADLEAIILRCLEKSPQDRPRDARELRAALDACADAGQWTEAQAAAWWRDHGGDLARREAHAALAEAATMAA